MCWEETVPNAKTRKLYYGRLREVKIIEPKVGENVGGDRSMPGRKFCRKEHYRVNQAFF